MWVKEIEGLKELAREDNSTLVKEAGFDARATADLVAGLYKR